MAMVVTRVLCPQLLRLAFPSPVALPPPAAALAAAAAAAAPAAAAAAASPDAALAAAASQAGATTSLPMSPLKAAQPSYDPPIALNCCKQKLAYVACLQPDQAGMESAANPAAR